jgi:two-component system sensor histidine kinase UhpB
LHEDLNVAIFRMVQEALNNIARHAQATQVDVQLTASDAEWLRLVVSDNGVGMAAGAPAGLGLTGIRERAELLGGSCTIESGNGVRLTLRLPLSPVPLPEDPDDD